MNHLDKDKLDKVCERLWHAHGSLLGLGGLFTQGTRDICFDDGEFYGIGLLIKTISQELEILEDILRCGIDSTANEGNGMPSNNKKVD